MNRHSLYVVVLAVLLPLGVASAGSPLECAPTESIDKYRMLKQLSLDLLGRIPTLAEYEALHELEDVDAETITALLSSEDYFTQVRDYHRRQLWAGLPQTQEVVASYNAVAPFQGIYRVNNMRRRYRGRAQLDCLDQEQTEFDPETGRPVPIEIHFPDPDDPDDPDDPWAQCNLDINGNPKSCQQEGWVMVNPHWAPETEIKVCAFDAQEFATNVAGDACLVQNFDVECGCGPGLLRCLSNSPAVEQRFRDSISEEPTRIFEWVVREGRSYLEAFTTKTSFVNGPLLKLHTDLSNGLPVEYPGGVGYETYAGTLPQNPDYNDVDTWYQITREDVHSGVLTTPGFLLRLASHRARLNRFYTGFRCEPFLPPEEGLPPAPEGEPNPNLREREGCAFCHQTIEPEAAYFGRWRTNGSYGYLDSNSTPETLDLCSPGYPGSYYGRFCDQYYVTARNQTNEEVLAEYENVLQATAFLSDEEAAAIDVGPGGLVDEDSEKDKVASCTVRTLTQHLLNRDLTEDEVITWLPELISGFEESNYNFTTLVRTLISSTQYNTIR